MHTRYTVSDIMALEPCADYTQERVTELFAGREALSLLEVLDLDIPPEDRIWVVTQLMPERDVHAFARWCARRVLYLLGAPEVVRRYLETGDESLRAAALSAARAAERAAERDAERDAARAAALAAALVAERAAARDAARDAARAAALVAARDAARAAARSTAWSTARAAAWNAAWAITLSAERDAARAAQIEELRRITRHEKENTK